MRRDAAPDATSIPHYVLSSALTQASMVSGNATLTLPAATLQTPWRTRNRGYLDPYQLAYDPHTLTLILTVTGTTHFLSATLTTTEISARTGLVGSQYVRDPEWGITSGLIEDPKTGQDLPADEAVQDAYTSLKVAAENWDPRQRRRPWKKQYAPRMVWRP